MSVQLAREELAAVLNMTGWNRYDSVVETVDPPAVVIGLPVFDYARSVGTLYAVRLPITLHYSTADLALAQAELIQQISPGMGGAIDLIRAARGGTYYRSLTCASTSPFVKTSADTLAVDMNLELTVVPVVNPGS